ncbi:hypothetical protein HY496_01860 [Candidatus Woesearchaeota archaeon]|nr:hypothetical protein [Candidatus Woesearchaeota archaeon]
MKRIYSSLLTFSLFVVVLLLTSCNPSPEAVPENVTDAVAETSEDSTSEVGESLEIEATACIPQWKCVSSKIRRFQESNCTFKARDDCTVSCDFATGKCQTVQCDEGYLCENPNTRAFRDKFCTWMLREKCEFGCEKGVCRNQSQAENAAAESVAESSAPVVDPYAGVKWLDAGASIDVAVGNTTYPLSIRILEAGRAKMRLGDVTSDWLSDGGTASFLGGKVTFTVVEINFQSYDGGLKQVGYRLTVN